MKTGGNGKMTGYKDFGEEMRQQAEELFGEPKKRPQFVSLIDLAITVQKVFHLTRDEAAGLLVNQGLIRGDEAADLIYLLERYTRNITDNFKLALYNRELFNLVIQSYRKGREHQLKQELKK